MAHKGADLILDYPRSLVAVASEEASALETLWVDIRFYT
jgi:hypothetical protein